MSEYKYGDRVVFKNPVTKQKVSAAVIDPSPGYGFVAEVYLGSLVEFVKMVEDEQYESVYECTWLVYSDEIVREVVK